MIKAYRNYWMGYVDFKGRTSVGGYWLAVLANLLFSFILSLVLGIFGAVGQTEPMQSLAPFMTSFLLLSILPSLAIVVRRLRDAGCSWTNLFWALLPFIGSIVLIVKLCKPSKPLSHSELSAAMKPKQAELGQMRIPAAILILWSTFTSFTSYMYAGILFHVDIAWWLSRLAMLALVVLLFIGKKNAGLLIPSLLELLLIIIRMANGFSIYMLLYTVAWATVCLVISIAVFKKSLPSGLVYLPAIMLLVPSIFSFASRLFRSGFFLFDIVYLADDILWALAFLYLAKALAEDPRKRTASSAQYSSTSYSTYQQQPDYRQPSAPYSPSASNQRTEPGVLLVRFSIDKLNNLSGSYGFQSGYLLGRSIPPELLEGMAISDGDSAATLAGSEYVCVVSISSINGAVLGEKIEPLILASREIRENGALPLTQIINSTSEPLVMNGVVRNGKIEGSGGWCANGFMSAWKEAANR